MISRLLEMFTPNFDKLFFDRIFLAIVPVFIIIVIEHVLLSYFYKKESSLIRLTRKLNSSSILDYAYGFLTWMPLTLFRFIKYLTLPGLLVLGFHFLGKKIDINGVLFNLQPSNVILNLILWYLVFDFGHFVPHYMMHKFSFLWRFHKFHHGATDFNIITGVRTSFAERTFTQVISFLMITVCFGIPSVGSVAILIAIRRVVELLQHSDLPWDYGWVGKIVAGPLFHRMHHSNDPRDYNANYGNLFTFWDYIFRTRSKRYVEQGAIIAEGVTLGLDSESETTANNRFLYGLTNETFLHYILIALGKFGMYPIKSIVRLEP